MEQVQAQSILDMARGAIKERCDYEMTRVMQNICDPNTKADAKRVVTVTITLTPDDERENIGISVTAKSTLAPTNPVTTTLYVEQDDDGNIAAVEMVPSKQVSLFDNENQQPKMLKMITG
jgi:hypothetical protein